MNGCGGVSVRFSAATTASRMLPERLALRARPLLTKLDDLIFSADERGAASRMSLTAFAIRVISAVIAFASQVLLARWMASFEYGIYVLVWTTMVIIGSVSSLGFHTSVIRYVSEYRERGMLGELRGILLASRVFTIAASSVATALGLLGVWLLSGSIENYYVVPFYIGLLCLPMIALGDVMQGIARGNSWVHWALAPTYLIRPVLLLAFMWIAVQLGYPVNAQTGIAAAVLSTYATSLGQLLFMESRLRNVAPPGQRTTNMHEWLLVSLPIFLVEGFFFLVTNTDVLMVGYFMEPHDTAVYFATVKTLALVHFVYFAVKAGVAQRYAQFAHGNPEKLRLFAQETVSWTFWPSLVLAALILLIGKPMLWLFGPDFTAGYPLLFILMIGVVTRASIGPAESLLTMSGNQNACAAAYAATLAVNVVLSIILIPTFGLWGAAIATTLSMVFEAVVLSFIVWRRLGIVMSIFASRLGTGESR